MEILSNTSTVLTTLLALGLVSGMFRSYFMYSDETHRLNIAKTTQTIFVFSSLFVLLLLPFSSQISWLLLGDKSHSQLISLVILSIMLTNLLVIPFSILRAKDQSMRYVVYSLIQFFINMGVTIYLVAVAKRGVKGNFEGMVIGQLVIILLFTGIYIQLYRAKFSRADAREMLSFGLPFVPAMLAAISLTVADRYFLRVYSTFDEIGVYGLGYKIGLIVSVIIVTPFMLGWGPIMWSVAEKPYAKQFYANVLTYFLTIGLFLALALSILSPEVIQLMSQRESYWRAWQVVPMISLSYVFYGIYYQMNVGINLKKKTKYIPMIVGGAAIINLLLNYLLIPNCGMIGAAIATILSYAILVIFSFFISRRLYQINYQWKRIIKLSIIFTVLLSIGLLISFDSILISLAVKLIILLFFPILLILTHFFNKDEIQRLQELFNNVRKTIGKLFRRFEKISS